MSPALWWIAVTVPVFLVSVWMGIRTVRSLIRTTRASVVASVPLRERQILSLPGAGDYDLYVEGKEALFDVDGPGDGTEHGGFLGRFTQNWRGAFDERAG